MRLNFAKPSPSQLWLLYAISLFAWSFSPICVRFAFEYDLPPLLLSAGRMVIGAGFFTPHILHQTRDELRKIPPKSRLLAIFAGGTFGVNITLMIASLEHVSVIISQALIATIPIWVAILEVAVLKARLNRLIWGGIVLAIGGSILIAITTSSQPAAIPGGNAAFGILMAMVSAAAASGYVIIGRKVRGQNAVPFVPYIWLVYTSGAVMTILMLFFSRTAVLGYDPRGYFWVLLMAIFAQVMGHGALNYILKFMSPTTLSVTSQSVPILSAIWAFGVFSETPTAFQLLGGIVILGGVIIVLQGQNPARVRKPPG